MKVFVYGTLKEGGRLAGQFDAVREAVAEAELEGFDLFNLGWFPGVKPGEGTVKGEVHTFGDNDAIIRRMDAVEGANIDDPKQGLYRREAHQVKLADGTTEEAFVYIYNGAVDTKEKVEDGDWPI